MASRYTPAYLEQDRQSREDLVQGIGKAAEMAQQQKLQEGAHKTTLQHLLLGKELEKKNKIEEDQTKRNSDIDMLATAAGKDPYTPVNTGDQTKDEATNAAGRAAYNRDALKAYLGGQYGKRLVKAGGVEIGAEPHEPVDRTPDRMGRDALHLQQDYKSTAKPHEETINNIHNIHVGLESGNKQGDEVAMVNLARMAEGKGQRLLQSVIQTMGGNPTLYTKTADIENFFRSKAQTGLSPDARNAIRAHINRYYNEVAKPDYEDSVKEIQGRAPMTAPTIAAQGDIDHYLGSYGTGTRRKMQAIEGYQQKYSQQHAPKQGLMFQPGSQSSPQAPSPQPQQAAPQTPSLEDIQNEIMRRKAGQ